jgi:hypothetical protein
MPNLVAWLLDKNVVRRAIEGIGASIIALPLTTQKSEALRLLRWGKRNNIRMMIAPETANILSRRNHLLSVQLLLREVDVILRGRYFQRWARRLREYGFTLEDAKVLSYGTFGLNQTSLGVTTIITFDRPFINNFEAHKEALTQRLRAMTVQLSPPYNEARLPEMAQPQQVLRVPNVVGV